MSLLVTVVYVIAALLLAVYGFNAILLTILYLRRRCQSALPPPQMRWPTVTVQLPVYNERYVVTRIIDAVARFDWPRDRLEIQVLDDSTDDTTAIARAVARRWRRQGVDVRVIHRSDRTGFKAGALAHGLTQARGEFIAIFDADFVPPRDFLQRTISHLLADPGLGMVQARWGHLNADYSPLTRAEALAIDGHFVVEQAARQRNGLFMNFNGTAGVWRRACIESAGGWQADTLAEDVDLSYRAQLAGWRLGYLPDVVAPAELPPQIHAFKAQQFRWAKGSIQVVRKLGRRLLTSEAPLFVRLEGLLHLTGYLVHPLMLLLLLSIVPAMIWHVCFPAPMAYLSLATLGPPLLYGVSQRSVYPDWRRRMLSLPLLACIGTGIALSNTRAVLEALLGRQSSFRRTPKFRVQNRHDAWRDKDYTLPLDPLAVGEMALALYAGWGIVIAWQSGQWFVIPYMSLYAAGFGLVALLTLLHSRRKSSSQPHTARNPDDTPTITPRVLRFNHQTARIKYHLPLRSHDRT